MAKFKVGDRVRIIDTYDTQTEVGDVGVIKVIDRETYNRPYGVELERKSFWFHDCDGQGNVKSRHGQWVSDKNIELVEPRREFKLIVISKGDVTTAKLIHGKDVTKEATVTRYSTNEYSEKAAVEAVVEKIFGESEKKDEANKPYTGKAVWIADNESVFTKGKIYEFVDGKFKHDLGFTFGGYTREKMKRLGCFLPIVE